MSERDPFSLAAGVPPIEGSLTPPPKYSARVSKKVVGVLVFLVVGVLLLFVAAIDAIDQKPSVVQSDKTNARPVKVKSSPEQKAAGVGGKDELDDGGSAGDGPRPMSLVLNKPAQPAPASASVPEPVPVAGGVKPPVPPPSATQGLSGQVPAMGSAPIPKDAQQGAVTPEEQARRTAAQERANRQRMARENGLDARAYNTQAEAAKAAPAGNAMDIVKALDQSKLTQPAAAGVSQGGKGDSEQESKLTFLKTDGRETHGYHPHMPTPPLSANEIKPGDLIPMRLERGINSDLPGMVTARVSEWVYDSVTGCKGLIPPLSVVVGKYDSKIALGQERILTVWNVLVFPDGSELNMAAMQGYDREGMAGMAADVDNHYLRLFGVGLGMSFITAGTQASVPQPSQSGATSVPTFGQQVGTAMAQQYGQLGAQLMGKYAAVQPTLRNFPGESFNVLVPRTLVFNKVWRDRCNKRSR